MPVDKSQPQQNEFNFNIPKTQKPPQKNFIMVRNK